MNIFAFIKGQVPILDVVNEYVQLKRAGEYYKGTCPFHHERTASFTVSPHKGIFYCFGCHATGDVIAFITQQEHYSPLQAAQFLIDRFGLTVPDSVSFEHTDPDARKGYTDLCELVTQWARENFKNSARAQEYCTARGLSSNTVQLFGIGYFPSGNTALKSLVQYVQTRGHLVAELLHAHIIDEGKHGLYSSFEERLLFPIKDHLGRVCGFGGRVFKEADDRVKYYNSKENEFFNKGSLLFGLDLAKKTMHEQETVFLVEGYTDCMAMAQHGYANTVATLGTACTVEHLRQLARHVHTVYVLYDGDAAGQKAMLRLADLCWQVTIELRIVQLPIGEDPASFLHAGNILQPLIQQATDIFSFYVYNLENSFAQLPISHKIKSLHKLLGVVARINDPLKQDLIIQQCAQATGLSVSILKRELQGVRITQVQDIPVADDPLSKISLLEKKIVSAILAEPTLLKDEERWHVIRQMDPRLRTILERIRAGQQCTEDEQQLMHQIMISQDEGIQHNVEQLWTQFQKNQWKAIVQDIKHKIAQAEQEHDAEQVKKLLASFQELKKKSVARE